MTIKPGFTNYHPRPSTKQQQQQQQETQTRQISWPCRYEAGKNFRYLCLELKMWGKNVTTFALTFDLGA